MFYSTDSSLVYSTEFKQYQNITEDHVSKYERRCIDGRVTGCGKCVGYCEYNGHRGFLTAKHAAEHKCMKKGCYYFIPKVKSKGTFCKGNSLGNYVLTADKVGLIEYGGVF